MRRGKGAHEAKASVTPKKTTKPKKKQPKRKLLIRDETNESEGEPENRPTGKKKRTPRAVYQSGGSSGGAGLRPEVYDELTGNFADSDEGAGTSLENDDDEDDASIGIEKTDDERTYTYFDYQVKGVAEMNIAEEANEENTERVEEQKDDEELKGYVPHIEQEPFHVEIDVQRFTQVPNSEAVKFVVQRFTELERAVKELKQADHSTTILASIRSLKDHSVVNRVSWIQPSRCMQNAIKEALEKTPLSLGQSSSQGQSHLTHDTHQEIYDAHMVNVT
ncbi:hypothetical protein Tco_0321466 [Tanacetum coccineum]